MSRISGHAGERQRPAAAGRTMRTSRPVGEERTTYVDATLALVCVVVEAPPRWLPPGVGGSELSEESECALRGRLGDRSE